MNLNRKIYFLLLCFFLIDWIHSYGQANLVLNPSLEQYSLCPYNQGQINYASNWYSFGGSVDYFNKCDTLYPDFMVPNNWGGYQQPASGFAYGALGTYLNITGDTSQSNVREYAGGDLSSPLTIGTKYFVSFKVSLSLSDYILVNTASNNVGVNFSTISYTGFDPFPITNTAKVNASSIITDTASWTQIFGSFIADSAYEYIVLGNFFDDNNTDTISMNGGCDTCTAYYFFDDICVSTDSLFALNYVFVNVDEYWDSVPLEIYPNPIVDLLSINNLSGDLFEIRIYDGFGRNVAHNFLEPYGIISFDFLNLINGIYYILIITNNNFITYKTIKL